MAASRNAAMHFAALQQLSRARKDHSQHAQPYQNSDCTGALLRSESCTLFAGCVRIATQSSTAGPGDKKYHIGEEVCVRHKDIPAPRKLGRPRRAEASKRWQAQAIPVNKKAQRSQDLKFGSLRCNQSSASSSLRTHLPHIGQKPPCLTS